MGKDVNIRELHEKTGKWVDKAARGDVIVILRKGQPVAEMRRYEAKPQKRVDFVARMKTNPKSKGDSTLFLEEDRK